VKKVLLNWSKTGQKWCSGRIKAERVDYTGQGGGDEHHHPGANLINRCFFFFVTDDDAKKDRAFVDGKPFQLVASACTIKVVRS
jgi:hypothetical protein